MNKKILNEKILLKNLSELKHMSNNKLICAMVKADAYGHGINEVCSIIKNKVDYYGVSSFNEAMQIRSIFKNSKILIVGKTLDLLKCINNSISFTVENIKEMEDVSNICLSENKNAYVHIKLNTGMNRLGISNENELKKLFEIAKKNDKIIIEGIYTHFYMPSNQNDFENQMTIFKKLLKIVPMNLNPIISIGGSEVLKQNIPNFVNMIRIGIGIYGYGFEKYNKNIKPVMKIDSEVVKINHIKPFDVLGYSKGFRAVKPTTVAVIRLGYADGVSRALKDVGYVYINNEKCKIIGNVCMDMMFVNVTNNKKTVTVGSKVTILKNANEWSSVLKTIPYEILTNFISLRN